MNRTEIIEKIIERFKCEPYEVPPLSILKKILEEELPDFQRIDEHRIGKILNNIVGSSIYYDQLLQKSVTLEAVRIYNSTLSKAPAQPPALKPLPKEMPEWFHGGHNFYKLWNLVCHNYGTPEPKPSLPTVEELAKEMLNVWNVNTFNEVAEYVIDKYSLHTREWWKDCEKFMYKGRSYKKYSHEVFPDGRTVLHSELAGHDLIYCTPYTPPSAQDIIAKHNLSEDEVRAIREGKCT